MQHASRRFHERLQRVPFRGRQDLRRVPGRHDEGDKKRRAATTTNVNPRGLYECITLWVLLEEACRGLGLSALRDSVQALLNTFEAFKNIPVLALAAALLYPRLNTLAKRFAKVPLPIVALKTDENDIEATESVILFREFIPMGGMAVTGNRLSTISGQSVLIKAGKVFVNPHIIIFAWRYLFKVLPTVPGAAGRGLRQARTAQSPEGGHCRDNRDAVRAAGAVGQTVRMAAGDRLPDRGQQHPQPAHGD